MYVSKVIKYRETYLYVFEITWYYYLPKRTIIMLYYYNIKLQLCCKEFFFHHPINFLKYINYINIIKSNRKIVFNFYPNIKYLYQMLFVVKKPKQIETKSIYLHT